MIDSSGVAERLKQARVARGLPVREWAELLGGELTPSRVTDVERKKQKPPAGMLLAAVQEAGLSSDWLLNGIGPMLAKGKPESAEAAIEIVQAVSLKLAGLKLDKRTMRQAHQWLAAIELGDVPRLRELANEQQNAVAHEGQPVSPPGIDTDVLTRVLAAVLGAAEHTKKRATPVTLARVTVTLYALAGRGLEIDEVAAAAAFELAGN